MDNPNVRVVGPKKAVRIFHWTVATVFFVMVITGLILYVPAFSGLAAGGWTRLIHRIASVLLIGIPVVYAVANPASARRWLAEAILFNRRTTGLPQIHGTWKRMHKSLITIGYVIFGVTGMIQWFLKGTVPSQTFQMSLLIHDIVFFAALLVLLYHIYYELDWWLWRRSYCRNCVLVGCVDACPNGALGYGADGSVEYYPQRCSNCRLCMEYCKSNSCYKKAAKPKAAR
jgi:cytochrome b subunit of formate dehydrogenase